MGWKIMVHLFKMTRNMQLQIKDTYVIIKKSTAIYIEYLDQVTKTELEYDTNDNTIEFGKIFTFIQNKVFDGRPPINSALLIKISETEVSQMIKITETLLLWNNNNFTLENRLSICNQFLQSYILLLNKASLIHYRNALEFLLEKTNVYEFEEYTLFLTEYYLFVSRKKKQPSTESIINNIYLTKYYSQIDEFDKMMSLMKKGNNPKVFIKWFFAI
jgi:hypothetical protein